MNTQNKKVAIITGGGSGLGFAIAKGITQNQIQNIISEFGQIDILVNNF